jgi:AraC-like DNA-binding protein
MNADLSLVSIGQVRPNPRWGMPSHQHDFHELIAVVGGRMTVRIPGNEITARQGTVLFYPAGVPHEEINDARRPVHSFFTSFYCVSLDPKVAWSASDPNGRIGALLSWLFDERHATSPMTDEWRVSLVRTALLHYLRLVSATEPGLVEMAREFMHSRLSCKTSLDEIAEAVGLTRFHFARQYKRLAGSTPMNDFRRIRAEAARDLLLDSNLVPKEIAASVGFANHPHLSRMMRRYLDTTPAGVKSRISRGHALKIEDYT